MDTLQRFKLTDAIGQVLITLAAYFLLRSDEPYNRSQDLVACYLFGVGAWQATSCLIWALATPASRQACGRKIYSWLLLALCILALVTLAGNSSGAKAGSDAGVAVLLVLLILGPVMSAWYFALTMVEASSLGKK